jgi:hypothetical protein
MFHSLFESQDQFMDVATYDKSRLQIYAMLAELASAVVDKESFLSLLQYKADDKGSKNNGNGTTQNLKWCVRYHRSRGVHVTPTCFVNDIEVSS